VSAFSAHGVVESQSQYADSIKGRGELTATDQGFEWTVRKLLSGQKDGARWKNVHTFGRQGHVLNIAYQFHYELGMKPFMAAVWFEGP
jgi:hypothetical protein